MWKKTKQVFSPPIISFLIRISLALPFFRLCPFFVSIWELIFFRGIIIRVIMQMRVVGQVCDDIRVDWLPYS
jgi:hypothetical protein